MTRPHDWSSFHDRCLTRLTSQWQSLDSLKFEPHDGAKGYADLVDFGAAEVKREPIVRHGMVCGTCSYYRLAPELGERG